MCSGHAYFGTWTGVLPVWCFMLAPADSNSTAPVTMRQFLRDLEKPDDELEESWIPLRLQHERAFPQLTSGQCSTKVLIFSLRVDRSACFSGAADTRLLQAC